ncbi:2372_t:CDS:2, partial [Dentiscutata erythropus]
ESVNPGVKRFNHSLLELVEIIVKAIVGVLKVIVVLKKTDDSKVTDTNKKHTSKEQQNQMKIQKKTLLNTKYNDFSNDSDDDFNNINPKEQ